MKVVGIFATLPQKVIQWRAKKVRPFIFLDFLKIILLRLNYSYQVIYH